MTICIPTIVPPGNVGGIATFNDHFTRLFHHQKHRVVLLTVPFHEPRNTDDQMRTEEQYTVVIINRGYYQYWQYYRNYFAPGGSNLHKRIACGLAMQDWLLQNHKKYGIDIIEAPDGGGLGIFFCHNDLPPVVLTAHGSNIQISQLEHIAYDEQGKLVKHLELLTYQQAAAIISNSKLNSEKLKAITSQPVLLATVPWLSKPAQAAAVAGQWGLVLGWMRSFKGPQVLCAALRLLRGAVPGITVKWAGGDTTTLSGYPSTYDFIRHRYPDVCDSQLQFLGPLDPDDARALLEKAGYVIIPSVWETFNYVALEAASAGKAIIISCGAGASYLFSDDGNALVVDANDPEKLAQAIRRLQTDDNLKKRLGEQAKVLIQERFRPEQIVEERICIYEQVIKNHQRNYAPTKDFLLFLKPYLTKRRKMYFKTRMIMRTVIEYLNKRKRH